MSDIVKRLAENAGATLQARPDPKALAAFTLLENGRVLVELNDGNTHVIATEADRRVHRLPPYVAMTSERFLQWVGDKFPMHIPIRAGAKIVVGANRIREVGRE